MIKALIWAIISLLMLFVMTSGIGSAYYYGISNNQYKDGYKKGFHAGVEYVIEFAKQKKNEE